MVTLGGSTGLIATGHGAGAMLLALGPGGGGEKTETGTLRRRRRRRTPGDIEDIERIVDHNNNNNLNIRCLTSPGVRSGAALVRFAERERLVSRVLAAQMAHVVRQISTYEYDGRHARSRLQNVEVAYERLQIVARRDGDARRVLRHKLDDSRERERVLEVRCRRAQEHAVGQQRRWRETYEAHAQLLAAAERLAAKTEQGTCRGRGRRRGGREERERSREI